MKSARITITTSQEILDGRNISLDDIKNAIQWLGNVFGKKYVKLFPVNISSSQEIDIIISTQNILSTVSSLEGFKRHTKLYTSKDFYAHKFVAIAAGLLKEHFSVILEPIISNNSGNPDIELIKNEEKLFLECKTIQVEKYFEFDKKSSLAEIILKSIETPNQLSVFFRTEKSEDEIKTLFGNQEIANRIITASAEENIDLENSISINVIPRAQYHSPNIESILEMIMEDVYDGIRKPGYVFMKSGRSVGIFGPIVDFSQSLESRRKKSQHQYVKGFPYVLLIDSSNILGNPSDHIKTIKSWFTPKINTRYSGVFLLQLAQRIFFETESKWTFIQNKFAARPLSNESTELFQSMATNPT